MALNKSLAGRQRGNKHEKQGSYEVIGIDANRFLCLSYTIYFTFKLIESIKFTEHYNR